MMGKAQFSSVTTTMKCFFLEIGQLLAVISRAGP